MADKLKVEVDSCEQKPFYRRSWCLTAIISFIVLSYYTWTKICQIIRQSQSSSGEGWWRINRLTGEDQTSLSFTGSEFYLLLLGVIKDDILSIFSQIYNLKQYVLIVASLITVCASSYYLYKYSFKPQGKDKPNKKDKDEPIKKEKNPGYTKAQPHYGLRHQNKPSTGNKLQRLTSYSPTRKYYGRWLTGILFFGFLLSIPWEYVRLYQVMVAEKVSQMTTGIPPECVPDQMSMTESLKSWLRDQFSWSADPCLQYHKALLVDPMWQVSPLMVITSAMSHCLLYPIEFFFSGMGKAMRLFFNEIPVQWQPVMFIMFALFLSLFMIMAFGYRIRCPLISIEPRKSVTSHLDRKQLEKLIKSDGDLSIDSSLDYSITSSLETDICSTQDSIDSQYK